jgi:hypothetical protein
MSQRTAARVVGFGLIAMVFLVIFIDLFGLSNFVGKGDAAALADDIEDDDFRFGISVAGYLIILVLDVLIAVALYVLLKPTNKDQTLLAMALRLLYTAIMVISVLALSLQFFNAQSYSDAKLIAYLFFMLHLFVLGYLVFQSGYIPRSLGVLLIIASFCYVVLFYGDFFLSEEWYDASLLIVMLPAAFSEIALGIWLLVKADELPEAPEIDTASIKAAN